MSKSAKRLSTTDYIKRNFNSFSLINFYEYHNFESRELAECSLKAAVNSLLKKSNKNSKDFNNLLNLISKDKFSYLKTSAIEVHWKKVEARNAQLQHIYQQSKVQAIADISVLHEAEASTSVSKQVTETKEEKKNTRKDSKNVKRKYILDISEVQNQSKYKERRIENKLSVEDRLFISSITLIEECAPLPKYKLGSNLLQMIKDWRTAVEQKKDMFIPANMPTKKNDYCIYVMLSSILLTINRKSAKESSNLKFKYSPSEFDFIVKHVQALFQNIFAMDDTLFIDWDTTSIAVKEIPRGYAAYRPDCIISTNDGIEVGTVEIKPLNTCKEKINVDKCKIAEICKRQLHLRIKAAKSTKEFVTFGILVAGKRVYFSSSSLEEDKYKYQKHEEVLLPTFKSTTDELETFLKAMLSFKALIVKSLSDEKEKEQPPISFDDYFPLLKPTIALKHEKEN